MRREPGERTPHMTVWHQLFLISLFLVLFAIALFDASRAIGHMKPNLVPAPLGDAGLTLLWVLLAFLLLGRGRAAITQVRDRGPIAERRTWNLVINIFAALGYVYLIVVALGLLRVNLGGLLIGGAVTGIVLGMAAQSALGNLFGGMLVLFLHPYSAGERITIRSGNFGGAEYTGTVREVTLFYTTLETTGGNVLIPNALAATSVVRVEGTGDTETVTVPIPYTVAPKELMSQLSQAGLDPEIRLEGFSDASYTARIRVPAREAERVVAVIASWRTGTPGT